MRVHRSSIVNLRHVLEYNRQDGGYVKLSSGKLIEVASSKRDRLLDCLDRL